MTSHLITEAQMPILESLDQNAAKKLKEMCRDIEGLMINTNSRISTLLQNQQASFFKAFKIVVEQISSDFRNLQQKFEEYIAYHENETEVYNSDYKEQVVNAQNKLVFFRNECQVLNKLCTELKCENQQLKVKIKEIEQEVNNQKMILHFINNLKSSRTFKLSILKQATQNSQLQQLILYYKQKQEAQNQQQKHPRNDSIKFHSLINKDSKLRVPQLKLHHRYHTEIQENDHNSIITYSQKHQTINICKTSKPKPNLNLLNRTTDDILETQTEKQNVKQFDQFYERSYKSRAKSQQQTMKIHENSETTQKTQEISSSLIKNIRVNPSYYQQNLIISS